jgi:long-chain acyl-CoA synthetase
MTDQEKGAHHRSSLAEFFTVFDQHPQDIAYAQSAGYRMARWTYRHFAETAARFARELESRGITPGERVLLWGPNSAEWAAAFWGSILRGAVLVPMDWIASEDFARRVGQQVDARLVVAAREKSGLFRDRPQILLEELPALVAHHQAGEPGARYPAPTADRRALAEIVFTSGTTAEPKGVMISHGNILANLEPIEQEIRRYLWLEHAFHPVRFLNLLPLSHVFGQFMGLLLPAVMGGTVFFEHTLGPADIVRTLHDQRISVLVAVPRILESLRHKIERDAADAGRGAELATELERAKGESFPIHWWRFLRIHRQFGMKFWAVICGGATLPRETEEFWDRIGFAVIQGYGLTETTSLISLNHPFRIGHGSIGQVLPGREVKLAPNGEILVRGESVASGYWSGAEGEAALANPGASEWLHTGDIGALDAHGNLFFKGRRKNVIVAPSGMNIYPEDLEAALRRQPAIRDAVVLPLPQNGENEAAAVLLLHAFDSVAQDSAQAAIAGANSQLADYQRIRRWFVWPEADFPRTSTRKPRTDVIAARLAEQFASTPSDQPASAEVGSLAALIASVTGRHPDALTPEARLEAELGLSSLDRVELLSALEDRYQVSLNEAALTGDTTIAQLERLLGTATLSSHAASSGSARRDEQQARRSSPPIGTGHLATGPHLRPVEPAAHGAQEPSVLPLREKPSPRDVFARWPQRWPAVWFRNFIYTVLTWPATHLLAHPRVRGRDNLRTVRGPLLIVCNHVTEVDSGYIAAALPPRYRYRLAIAMGGERLRRMRCPPASRGFWGGALDRMNYFLVTLLFNVFPLAKLSGFRESFHFAGDLVDRGYSVIIFPEGDLTAYGSLEPFRSGVGLLAQGLHVPVLPMRIDGLFELRQKRRRTAPWGQVRVSIGAPIEFPREASAQEITERLHDAVSKLEWPVS